ncbi:MAG: S41 family peptidase [Planctomycetales bacterium]
MSIGSRFLRFCLAGLLLGMMAASGGSAAVRADDLPAAASTPDAIRMGVQFERNRQWIDAIKHYESALQDWPDDKDLQYGLRRAKVNFGIERRYADASFDSSLVRLSEPEALDLFDDVLGRIRSDFVDPLSATSFVAHGTESLYLALVNEKFRARNVPLADDARIGRVRSVLREQYWNKPVPHQQAARQTLGEICELGRRELGLSPGAVVMEYIFGGCNALDDYSNFLTPDRLSDLYGNIDGEFVGLGIEMKSEMDKGLLLVDVIAESPAAVGGLRPGEYITAIDGVDCRTMSTDEAARLLRGPSGSAVQLQVHGRDGASRSGMFHRRAVHVKSIPVARIIDRPNGIAYLRMTGFQKTTPAELDEALARLQREGMQALIWDLRGNPGGLLTAAVEVLDRFIDSGVLVSTKGRTRDQNWTYSAHRPGTLQVPLVLLVDGDSASASEIVAGAIHDHKRGTIVGRKTFGKWSVQSIFPVRGKTGLRLTTAKFYSPGGQTLGKIGVRPDVAVAAPDRHVVLYQRGPDGPDLDADEDLRKAQEVLRERYTRR